jgi:phosphate-selective porin OprO/OprP
VPEISSRFFIGRTKEGFSLSKVMSGYAVEMMERHMASDPIPILADGIKWMGFLPKSRIFWNVGIFTDWLAKGQSFLTDKWQFVTRAGWLPIHTEKTNLHLAFNIRLDIRSKTRSG